MERTRNTKRSRRPVNTGSGDAGQTLLLVLVFIAVFGLLISVLLGGVEVNLQTTSVVRSRTERVYTADAGIEYGIKSLAIDPTLCPSETRSALPSQTTNGRTATITCQATTSSSNEATLGGSGWAAIILGQQTGSTATISGPTYVGGTIAGIENTNGSLSQHFTSCPGGHVQPGNVTVAPHPPYSWLCTTAPPPDPPHVLPPAPTVTNPVPQDFAGNCRVFFPGKYTIEPDLQSDNYFVSGVYYFEDIGNWQVGTQTDIVGGTPAATVPPEANRLGINPCKANADATQGGGGTGYGVEWIFGGTSSMSFKNKSNIELYSRVPGPAEPATVTERMSFVSVPSTAAGYKATTPGITVFDTSGGHPGVAIHGLFYAPTADVDLDGPNGVTAMRNGIVVRNLDLKAHGSDEPIISIDTSVTNKRFAVLTATAASSDEASIVSTALVEIRNNTDPANIAVHSWRTG